jgi:hypothetical protein
MDARMPESRMDDPNGSGTDSASERRGLVDSGPAGAPGGHAVMFWVLVGMAVLVFAPCVLVPIWMQTEELMQAEREAQAGLAQLQARVSDQQRLIDGLRNDPLVNERVARRDLRFQHAAEEIVPVGAAARSYDAPMPSPSAEEAVRVESGGFPSAVESIRRWLPDLPWVELFGRPPNRTMFLLMAAGLVVTAFVLFGSSSRRQAPENKG